MNAEGGWAEPTPLLITSSSSQRGLAYASPHAKVGATVAAWIVQDGSSPVAITVVLFLSWYLPANAPVCGPIARTAGSAGLPLPVGRNGAVARTVGLVPNEIT